MEDFNKAKRDPGSVGPAGPAVKHLAERLDWTLFTTPPDGGTPLWLVAVSGGADSVFLARAMAWQARERAWSLLLAHVHHGLRGEEADADQGFVESLARELGVECVSTRLEPRQIEPLADERERLEAEGAGTSLEGRLRLARRGVLAALARGCGSNAIVTGHHRDDLAETFLLQALRGAGLTGLGSLAPRGRWEDVEVLRPMLAISHADILAALAADGFSWREDRTNVDRAFKRNWLRHEILPALEAYQPGCSAALARTARVCAEDSAELRRQGEQWLQCARPPAPALPASPDSPSAASARACGEKVAALDYSILAQAPPVLRRHALRAWLRELNGGYLSPPREALLELERSADHARDHGGERFVVSISRLLAWTDGRWLIATPSRGHADESSESLRRRIAPALSVWRSLWGLNLVFDSSNITETVLLSCDLLDRWRRRIGKEAEEKPNPRPARRPPARGETESGPEPEPRNEESERISPAAALPIGSSGFLRAWIAPVEALPVDWRLRWSKDLSAHRKAVFALEALHGPVSFRTPRPGDVMEMQGGGRKDLAQAMAEAGIPEALRPRLPLVVDAHGPLWLPGVRRAARCLLQPGARVFLLLSADTI